MEWKTNMKSIIKCLPPNVVIAGGYALHKYAKKMDSHIEFGDIDFYFYGVDNLYEALKSLVHALGLQDEKWERTSRYISYDNKQIILIKFDSVNDILNSFDLGSCQVAFDKNQFYTTELFHYSFNNRVNLIFGGYLDRIHKYKYRGFKPVFVMGKHKKDYVIHDYGVEYTVKDKIPTIIEACKDFWKNEGNYKGLSYTRWNNVLMTWDIKNYLNKVYDIDAYEYRFKYEWCPRIKMHNPYIKDSKYKPLWTPKKHKYYPELSLLGYELTQILPLDLVKKIFRLYTESKIYLHLC